jgi:hypothetical protein
LIAAAVFTDHPRKLPLNPGIGLRISRVGVASFYCHRLGSVGAVHNLDEVGETFRFDLPLAFGLAMLNSCSIAMNRGLHMIAPAKYPRGEQMERSAHGQNQRGFWSKG